MLKAISTLYSRALKYEQGDPIPCLVTVELELQGADVQFSPPLSTFSSVNCVPEVVQKWMSNYLSLAKLGPRFSSTVDRGTCFDVLSSDGEVKNAMSKICAHLVTNSRQCQVREEGRGGEGYMHYNIYDLWLCEPDIGASDKLGVNYECVIHQVFSYDVFKFSLPSLLSPSLFSLPLLHSLLHPSLPPLHSLLYPSIPPSPISLYERGLRSTHFYGNKM